MELEKEFPLRYWINLGHRADRRERVEGYDLSKIVKDFRMEVFLRVSYYFLFHWRRWSLVPVACGHLRMRTRF
jgi:hypothetical protein